MSEVVEQARSLLGVKWRHQGRSKISGLDCAGLIMYVGKEIGAVPIEYIYEDYGRMPDGVVFHKHFDTHLEIVNNRLKKQSGDVIVFKQDNYPCHCGIYVKEKGKETMIHANGHPRVNKVVEHPISLMWKKRIVAFYRFKKGL